MDCTDHSVGIVSADRDLSEGDGNAWLTAFAQMMKFIPRIFAEPHRKVPERWPALMSDRLTKISNPQWRHPF
jgi:hypothetical protein